MAECFACEQDMLDADGCASDRTITIDGTDYDPIPYGSEAGITGPKGPSRCHDCGAEPGAVHHPGCDMEECPNCGGQYFICDCDTDEKRTIWGAA